MQGQHRPRVLVPDGAGDGAQRADRSGRAPSRAGPGSSAPTDSGAWREAGGGLCTPVSEEQGESSFGREENKQLRGTCRLWLLGLSFLLRNSGSLAPGFWGFTRLLEIPPPVFLGNKHRKPQKFLSPGGGHTPAGGRRDRSGARGRSEEGRWRDHAPHTGQHAATNTRGAVLFRFQNALARNKHKMKACSQGRSISRGLRLTQTDLTPTFRVSRAP